MTGSFINNLYSNSKQKTPEIGMGVTECCWSDRHAYTIVDIISPREIVVQRDIAIRADNRGMTDSQDWIYERDPEGSKYTITLRKNGRWVKKGLDMKSNGWLIGSREEYFDFTF